MSFGREKRLLLGWLALLAPVPIPFNDLLAWPVLAVYSALLVIFLRRASEGASEWLPNWAMNLLGLAYIPVLALDFTVLFREENLLRPLIHLVLFSVTVKLFAIRRDRDVWQVFLGIQFLALAAIGTSVHPTIVIYLVAYMVLTLVALIRFAFFQVLAAFGHRDHAAARTPIRGFVVVATFLTVLSAIPLFALLPRVKSPFIMGQGTGLGGEGQITGFSDRMSLDVIGRIRGNREVALRARFEGDQPDVVDLRFKGATYDYYKDHLWSRQNGDSILKKGPDGAYPLSRNPSTQQVEIYLQPLASVAVPLPLEAANVQIDVRELRIDDGGAVAFPIRRKGGMRYVVGLASEPVLSWREPRESNEPTLDRTGVSQRIADLAAEVAGSGSAKERVGRIERHLLTSYGYTLDFVGRGGEEPLHDFLFETRSGHCEYFASAMVLMLRSQDIPARLITGFLGGDYNPLEGYVIVRQGNAHAWVEAWVEGEGWVVFDPTPPSGRPGSEPPSLGRFANQVMDYVLFRWDRYVLTFGVDDQVQFYSRMRQLWHSFLELFGEEEVSSEEVAGVEASDSSSSTGLAGSTDSPRTFRLYGWVLACLLAAFAAWFWWRAWHRPWTGNRTYLALRNRLKDSGLNIEESDPPLEVRRRAISRFPDAARQTDDILHFYLEESFAGRVLTTEECEHLRQLWTEARRSIRKAS